MSKGASSNEKQHWHDKGESDAKNKTYEPPYGSIVGELIGGKYGAEIKGSYDKGQGNTKDQKSGKR